jgi:hypothetical protein
MSLTFASDGHNLCHLTFASDGHNLCLPMFASGRHNLCLGTVSMSLVTKYMYNVYGALSMGGKI